MSTYSKASDTIQATSISHEINFSSPATELIDITAADSDLTTYAASLRITNEGTSWRTIRVTPLYAVDGTTSASYKDIKIPPSALTIEPLAVRRVWLTGSTTTDLTIQGYVYKTRN